MALLRIENEKSKNPISRSAAEIRKKEDVVQITAKDFIIIYYCINPANNHEWDIIIHKFCNSQIEIFDLDRYKVLACPRCKFRKAFPSKITTTEQLITYWRETYPQSLEEIKESEEIENRSEIIDIRDDEIT